MIDRETLRSIARTKDISNMSFAEQDYFQEIIMLGVSREAPQLTFKGGTALCKFHGLNRFSEDLDFAGEIAKGDARRISSYLENFGYPTEVSLRTTRSGSLLTFVTEGFLYQGTPEGLGRVQMDVGRGAVSDAEWTPFFSLYPDVPMFGLRVMTLEEIMAEKVRALLVRRKARDAYDIWFLLNKGVGMDLELVEEKLTLYGIELGPALLGKALDECERNWHRELRPLLSQIPEFDGVRREVRKGLGTRR
ncbi:MAG: nucleotidyl transferase AbiEii/AbiGii toxin family protein [Thermoplasmata archaeon]